VLGALPDRGQLPQLLPLGDDDEVPGLGVLGGRRTPAGLQDPVEVFGWDRLIGELPDVTSRRDRPLTARVRALDACRLAASSPCPPPV
jgi:hypothetical protein